MLGGIEGDLLNLQIPGVVLIFTRPCFTKFGELADNKRSYEQTSRVRQHLPYHFVFFTVDTVLSCILVAPHLNIRFLIQTNRLTA